MSIRAFNSWGWRGAPSYSIELTVNQLRGLPSAHVKR